MTIHSLITAGWLLGAIVCGIPGTAKCQGGTDSIILARLDVINHRIDSFGKKNDVQTIGVLQLNTGLIPLYYTVDSKKKKTPLKSANGVSISRVSLSVRNGCIFDITVQSEGKRFINKNAPISFTARRLQLNTDWLLSSDGGRACILFQDLFLTDSLTSYAPADGFYEWTPENSRKVLQRQAGLNTVVDLRLYSDALGLLGGTANGLAQTDARVKQYLHRRNVSNHGTFFLQYLKLNFNASKFDSKNKWTDSAAFSKTSLLQKKNVNGELILNIVNGWLDFKSMNSWYVDGGFGVGQSPLIRGTDSGTVTVSDWFLEGGVQVRSSDNTGMNAYLRIIDQYSPQTAWSNNDRGAVFLRIGGEVFWNPFGDVANRLFARINYTFATQKAEKTNGYMQMEFGYSVLLSSVVKK